MGHCTCEIWILRRGVTKAHTRVRRHAVYGGSCVGWAVRVACDSAGNGISPIPCVCAKPMILPKGHVASRATIIAAPPAIGGGGGSWQIDVCFDSGGLAACCILQFWAVVGGYASLGVLYSGFDNTSSKVGAEAERRKIVWNPRASMISTLRGSRPGRHRGHRITDYATSRASQLTFSPGPGRIA